MKIVLENAFEVESIDDGGQAMIAAIDDDREPDLFVRVQSWDEGNSHEKFKQLVGHRVRVTIETLD